MECAAATVAKTTTSNTFHKNDTEKKKVSVHWLPCRIEYDGPANIGEKFEARSESNSSDDNTQVGGQEIREAFFRGRRLTGKTLELPSDYTMCMLDGEGGCVGVECTQWSHAPVPDSLRMLDFLDIEL